MKSDYWTTQKVADEATKRGRKVSRQYIQQLCSAGTIKAERPGRDWLIPPSEAEAWLERWIGRE